MSHYQQLFFIEQVKNKLLKDDDCYNILEIGSYDVNGSIRKIFPNSKFTGYDLIPGPNVDVVYDGKNIISNDLYDISISCECFEHNPYYRESFHQMINLTKPSGLVIITCATFGRLEHGTTRTDNSSPGSMLKFNYYKNLSLKDFGTKKFLNNHFSSYSFFTNYWTHDLYFIGEKKGFSKFNIENFSEYFLEFNSIVSVSNLPLKKKFKIFLKKILLENLISKIFSDKIYRDIRIFIKNKLLKLK